jgi:type IV pilus assembly protein PilA
MNHLKRLGVGMLAAFAVIGVGCAKKVDTDAVPLVAASERSQHFTAVTNHLELGGTLYGYVDIDGDVERLAVTLRDFASQALAVQQPMAAAMLPKDIAPIFADLGLTDVKALGLSSVPDANGGFRNRVFLYTPDGRRGFFAALGGPAAPYITPALVSADTDFVYESDVDVAAVYAAIRAVIVRVAGEPMANVAEAKLKEVDPKLGVAPFDLLQKAKGRVSIALRLDPSRIFEPQPGVKLPITDLLVRVEGLGDIIDTIATNAGLPREVRADGSVSFAIPPAFPPELPWAPEFVVAGGVATLSTGEAIRAATGAATLAGEAGFKEALAQVGDAGNGLMYVSPRIVAVTRRLMNEATANLPPEVQIGVSRMTAWLPAEGVTLIATRQNLPDGVLFRSQWDSSLKASLVMANPGVVVTSGALAAMAIPAFQKVRATSQEKAVFNNLRQLSAARDQYFLETGKAACTYDDLVGPESGKYIRELKPVAGEDYTTLVFQEGMPLVVRLKDGREVSYGP